MGDRDTLVSSWRERVYLSTDVSFSSTDRLLGEFSYTHQAPEGGSGPLAAAGIVERREQVELPNDLPGGLFIFCGGRCNRLGIRIPKRTKQRYAGKSHHSCAPLGRFASAQCNGPRERYRRCAVCVSWTVRNAGNNSTTANYWYDDVYLSTDPPFRKMTCGYRQHVAAALRCLQLQHQ